MALSLCASKKKVSKHHRKNTHTHTLHVLSIHPFRCNASFLLLNPLKNEEKNSIKYVIVSYDHLFLLSFECGKMQSDAELHKKKTMPGILPNPFAHLQFLYDSFFLDFAQLSCSLKNIAIYIYTNEYNFWIYTYII